MKRKIQHDAVNNQEDEDSSACPIRFLGDEVPDKEEKGSDENNTTLFFREASNNISKPITHRSSSM